MDLAGQSLPRQLARAIAVVGLCAVVAWAMAPRFGPENLILVFMAGVVYVSATSSRTGSWWAIALSILVFDFIFVPPRWGFKPADPQDYFTLAVMVGVGLLVTELSTRARAEAKQARWRAERLQALNALALALAGARDAGEVRRIVEERTEAALSAPARLSAPGDEAIEPGSFCVVLESGTEVFGRLAVRLGPAPDPALREFVTGVGAQASLALARIASEARSEQAAVLAEGERLRNTLLSGLSHDFRTPLTTIVGATTSLIEQESALEPAARRRLLENVLREARRMHVMTSTLLDLTRMEEGALQPRFEWCPADELVQEVMRAMKPALAGFDVEARVEGESLLWCDPDLVERVLANLLDNAARHTPEGGRIAVSVRTEPGGCDIEVADSGAGVPAGEESSVFRKFYRASAGRGGGGTGLGLALCAAIARLHGGTIDVRNEHGAVFTMRLPQPALAPAALET